LLQKHADMTAAALPVALPSARLLRWQALTLALLVTGYAGYYLCRSNYSVVLPLLIDELAAHGWEPAQAKIRLGTLASLGVLAYALGKFLSGALADQLGGRRNFLLGMAGAVGCTLLFAAGTSVPLFTAAWLGNRFMQSLGWPGAVRLTARWFSYTRYGTVMACLSLSYLFGDAAARWWLGWLLAQGFGWRGVFAASAAVLGVLFLLSWWWLKEAPGEIGEPEPAASPHNLVDASSLVTEPANWRVTLGAFARSWEFWLICLLSFGMHIVRETFNTWTPTFFTQAVQMTQADAARQSAYFPFWGGVSALIAGRLNDRLDRAGRAAVIVGGMLLTCAGLLALGQLDYQHPWVSPVGLVAFVALAVIGPYSLLSGALALDFGGKRGSATASGLIDGVGYLGAVLAGDSIARLSVAYGWRGAFSVLAAVALLAAVVGLLFWRTQRRLH
jgi:sugar phosphate permease